MMYISQTYYRPDCRNRGDSALFWSVSEWLGRIRRKRPFRGSEMGVNGSELAGFYSDCNGYSVAFFQLESF